LVSLRGPAKLVFGAGHRYFSEAAAVYDRGAWLSPLGEIEIDEDIADAVVFFALGTSMTTGQIMSVDGGQTM
jgi:AmmeMemoRadiSam system protein B